MIVRQDHPARRCEVCHQTDQFDPDTGLCTRCAGVTVSTVSNPRNDNPKKKAGILYKSEDGRKFLNRMALGLLIFMFGGVAFISFWMKDWVGGFGLLLWVLSIIMVYRQSIEEVVSPDGQNIEIKRYASREFIDAASIVQIRRYLWGYGGIELKLESGKIIALDLDRADQQKLIEGLKQINPNLEIQ